MLTVNAHHAHPGDPVTDSHLRLFTSLVFFVIPLTHTMTTMAPIYVISNFEQAGNAFQLTM
jgi:hypothetical protein